MSERKTARERKRARQKILVLGTYAACAYFKGVLRHFAAAAADHGRRCLPLVTFPARFPVRTQAGAAAAAAHLRTTSGRTGDGGRGHRRRGRRFAITTAGRRCFPNDGFDDDRRRRLRENLMRFRFRKTA